MYCVKRQLNYCLYEISNILLLQLSFIVKFTTYSLTFQIFKHRLNVEGCFFKILFKIALQVI